MRYFTIAAGSIAVFTLCGAAAIEAGLRFKGGSSEAATGHLSAIALASTCPEASGALSRAAGAAYGYAWRNPADLPPWRVLLAVKRMERTAEALQPTAASWCGSAFNG